MRLLSQLTAELDNAVRSGHRSTGRICDDRRND